MSCYWYFECLNHAPTLRSDSEFTQHTDDFAFKDALFWAGERPVLPMHEMPDNYRETLDDSLMYFETNARRFLAQHPGCRLGIVNEYGEARELPGKPAHVVATARALLSPDCREGKHRACHGDSWDYELDQVADCACGCHASVALVKPSEDAFGITHGATVEQAVGFVAAQLQTLHEAAPTIRRLEGVIEQKAIEETK